MGSEFPGLVDERVGPAMSGVLFRRPVGEK